MVPDHIANLENNELKNKIKVNLNLKIKRIELLIQENEISNDLKNLHK